MVLHFLFFSWDVRLCSDLVAAQRDLTGAGPGTASPERV